MHFGVFPVLCLCRFQSSIIRVSIYQILVTKIERVENQRTIVFNELKECENE